MKKNQYQAVVLHSGGMDSSLCLALAIKRFGAKHVLSLSFKYGQRHLKELKCAQIIAQSWKVKNQVLPLSILNELSDSSLVSKSKKLGFSLDDRGQKIPNTMVVGRNGLMARVAGIFAHSIGAKNLYLGVMELETANSGYRDCSRDYTDLIQKALRLDFADESFTIHTPLIQMTKAESMQLGMDLKVLPFLLENTITCYEGKPKYGCGVCPACVLRNNGLRDFLKQHPQTKLEFSWKKKFNL